MYKMVDGELIEMTPEEVAQFNEQAAKNAQQQNLITPDPGPGPTFKQTLGVPDGSR